MSFSRAVVLNNQDPEKLSRLQVQIPALAPDTASAWAWPCVPVWNWPLPGVGDPVWVAFEAGDKGYPIWLGTWVRLQDANPAAVIPGAPSGPRDPVEFGGGEEPGTGGHIVAEEGTALPARPTLNFVGDVTASDDAANNRTNVVVVAGGGGGTGENEVFIGSSDPIGTYPTIELWIDTDATPASGAGVTNYTHNQATPSATWVVNHNLGFNPSVRAEDSSGGDIEGDVVYNSANQLTITFSAAIAGKSYHS